MSDDFLNNLEPKFPKDSKAAGTVFVLCAALWYDDGNKYVHQPTNINTGYVVCGRRHHNCFTIKGILQGVVDKSIRPVQGFVTSDNKFIGRVDAAIVAYESGQVTDKKEVLFSEDLY